jgi:hypothetical protein
MISKKMRGILLTMAVIAMCACAPLFLPSISTPVPTLAPGELEIIIAQTAAMAATQTEALITPSLTPTLTPSPTVTASVTPSPTATFIFLLPTLVVNPTGETGGKYACEITSVSPAYDAIVAPGQPFNARWELRNNGSEPWDSNSIDYGYFSGAKLHKGPGGRDLDSTVGVGGTMEIIIKMNAPAEPGTYSTVWKMHVKEEYFCSMTIQIIVPAK